MFLNCLTAIMLCACTCSHSGCESGIDLKVMSFNVRYDNHGDADRGEGWTTRRDSVAGLIHASAPDIVGTQEVLHHQFADLKERLKDYAVVGCGRDDGHEAGEYEALWFKRSRFEVADSGNFWLSATPDVAGSLGWDGACVRMASWALLKDKNTGRKLLAVNTHLDHVGEVARREGVNVILSRLDSIAPGVPAVVTGDFNSGPESAPVRHITDTSLPHHLVDSRAVAAHRCGPDWTFHDFNRQPVKEREVIDYVFVTPGIKVKNYRIINTAAEPGHNISDHCPVEVVLALP